MSDESELFDEEDGAGDAFDVALSDDIDPDCDPDGTYQDDDEDDD
jgi:hypothetical protein